MAFDGEGIGQAAAPGTAQAGGLSIVEGIDAIVAAQEAAFQRVVVEAGGDHAVVDIDRQRFADFASEFVAHHQACFTAAGERHRIVDDKRTARHVAAELADIVDVDIHRGRHHRAARQRRQRKSDQVRTQGEIAAELQAAQPHRARPVERGGNRIADLGGGELPRIVVVPDAVQPGIGIQSAAGAGDAGIVDDAQAAEQPLFVGQAQGGVYAPVRTALQERVVVEHQAGIGRGGHDAAGAPADLVGRHQLIVGDQGDRLLAGIVVVLQAGNLIQRDQPGFAGLHPVQADSFQARQILQTSGSSSPELAQVFKIGVQVSILLVKGDDRLRGLAVDGDVEIQRSSIDAVQGGIGLRGSGRQGRLSQVEGCCGSRRPVGERRLQQQCRRRQRTATPGTSRAAAAQPGRRRWAQAGSGAGRCRRMAGCLLHPSPGNACRRPLQMIDAGLAGRFGLRLPAATDRNCGSGQGAGIDGGLHFQVADRQRGRKLVRHAPLAAAAGEGIAEQAGGHREAFVHWSCARQLGLRSVARGSRPDCWRRDTRRHRAVSGSSSAWGPPARPAWARRPESNSAGGSWTPCSVVVSPDAAAPCGGGSSSISRRKVSSWSAG